MRDNSIIRRCRIHERMLCLLFILALSFFANSQTNYSPLYTSANFVKTVDLTKPVGTVGASAGTTPTGGVTYSIPIYTPPGTNGLQPSISITYNSQSGPGIVGYGWNIAGLSVICTRSSSCKPQHT